MYKCSICGKDYDNVKDRAECEIRCIHAAEEESKRIAKAEAEAARTKLANEIEEAPADGGVYARKDKGRKKTRGFRWEVYR